MTGISAMSKPRISTNPMGHVLWSFPGGLDYIWYGRGSHLFLALAYHLSPVLHPAACGAYDTKKEAERALYAFLAAVEGGQGDQDGEAT